MKVKAYDEGGVRHRCYSVCSCRLKMTTATLISCETDRICPSNGLFLRGNSNCVIQQIGPTASMYTPRPSIITTINHYSGVSVCVREWAATEHSGRLSSVFTWPVWPLIYQKSLTLTHNWQTHSLIAFQVNKVNAVRTHTSFLSPPCTCTRRFSKQQ